MLNHIVLIGRLCADPDYRTTSGGVPVVSFRLAVERNFIDKQTGKREADFIDVVAWRERADFASRYFRKGQQVAVQGRLETRNFEDKSGNRRTAFEVQAENLYFADTKREGGGGNNYESPASYYSSNQPNNNTAPAIAEREEEPSSFSAGSDDDFTPVSDEDLPF
ncbi:MAG: single-stranded DNA-binding protein [Oscillospiraceae bacterium]|nr:single-stranded DNA-binding protein [Oscillospiraceae bacterium]